MRATYLFAWMLAFNPILLGMYQNCERLPQTVAHQELPVASQLHLSPVPK